MSPGPTHDPPAVLELVRVRLPLRTPLESAHGTERERDVVLVRAMSDDGAEGWGECSALSRPTYTHEYTAGAWVVLRDELGPAAVAGAPADVRTHPMAAAALDTALVDLSLRRRGANLAVHLGADRSALRRGAVVGVAASVDELVATAAEHVASGAVLLKAKVRPGWDVEPLRALRAAWPDLALAADANGSYDEGTVPLQAFEDLGLVYLEQPVHADALAASAAVAARAGFPVALDESAASRQGIETALAVGAGSVINVKPARLGGVATALEAARLAVGRGARCFVGGMLETGVGRAAAVCVAACDAFDLPTDLGPSVQYFDDDLTDAIVTDDEGRLLVPEGPGLGVVPRPERLAATAVDRCTLRRR